MGIIRRIAEKIIVLLWLLSPLAVIAQNPEAVANFSDNNGGGSPYIFGVTNQLPNATSINSLHSAGVTILRWDLGLEGIVPESTTNPDGTTRPTTVASYTTDLNGTNNPYGTNGVANPANWNWTKFDSYGAVFKRNGFAIMGIIDYCPDWLGYTNTPGQYLGVPSNWTVWEDIVQKVITHYAGQIDYLEVWNEPDGFLNLTNSPYSNDQAAYQDIYRYTGIAVREASSTIPLGGPAAQAENRTDDELNILHDTNIATGNINFLSFHDYTPDVGSIEQYTELWLDLAAEWSHPNIPIWITEWNYWSAYGSTTLNSTSPQAISFVGRQLTEMLNAEVTGSMIYAESDADWYFVDGNNALTPKGWAYRLLAKDLRLGSGTSQVASMEVPSTVTNGGAAVTADGNLAAWLVNDSATNAVVDLNLTGLTGTTGKATIYMATDTGMAIDASSPLAIESISVIDGQSVIPNLSVPAYSVVGVLLDGVHGISPGTRWEAESLPESNSSGVSYSVISNPGASNGQYGQIVSNSGQSLVGQSLTYTVGGMTSGTTYHVIVGYPTSTAGGEIQLSIGGTVQLQTSLIEEYSSFGPLFTESDLGTYTATSNSAQPFTFTVYGQNANSTGSGLAIDYITLIPVQSTTSEPDVAATPVFSPSGGSYTGTQTVAISSATYGADIYYTTDGTTPTTNSTLYSGSFAVSTSQTVQAIAVSPGINESGVGIAAYTINNGTAAIPFFPNGFSSTSPLQLNGNATLSGSALELTDGGYNEASSAYFTSPVNVLAFTNDFDFQLANPTADGFTFVIQNAGPTALGFGGGELGYGPNPNTNSGAIGSSVAIKFDLYNNAGEGNDSTGLYVDGASPYTPSTDLTSTPINLHSGDRFHIHMVYIGTTLTVTITDLTVGGYVTQAYTINIPSTVGSNLAYVGFTGGTGGATAVQQITNWVFTSNPYFGAAGFSSGSPLQLNGNARVIGSVLELTDGGADESSSAYYPTPVNIQKFTNNVNFQLTNPVADGFTLVIQNAGLTALGFGGGELGYGPNPSTNSGGIGSSVAIKFDLYNNAGEGDDSTGLYVDGASPYTPSTDLSSTGINFHSGDYFNVQSIYDGTTLTVIITDANTNVSATQSYTINIPATIGSNYAYLGFTAGTGGSSAVQNILAWEFQQPIS